MNTLSQHAAEWVCGFSHHDIPPEVIEDTKLRILDIVGVMLGGKHDELVSRVRRAASDNDNAADARALGFSDRTTLATAALINGVMASILEFDDAHVESGIHSTAPAASVAFPMGQKLALPGKRFIEAVLVGSELTCRLGQVAPGMLFRHGFHPTSVFGIFGAIYTLSKMLSLSSAQIVNAIGIGGSLSAGSMASWEDGTSAKSLHIGLVASGAVQAVSFAMRDISGPSGVFDGRFGFFRSHVQDPNYEYRFEALGHRLGKDWETLNVASKAYPCGYVIQPFIDAALELKARHGIQPDDISELTCFIADYAIALVCEPVNEKLRPKNTWHARVSLQHSVAEALVVGKLDKRAYEPSRLADPRINALADRVTFVADPRASDRRILTGEILLKLRDGRDFRLRIEHMRGTRANPMSREDFVAKFTANTSDVLPAALMRETIAGILDLEKVENVASVFGRLSA